MNWEALGAAAETLGAIAVIVSILYLAAQVRQSAVDVRSNIIHSLHSNEVELSSKPSVDAVLASAVEKAHTGQQLSNEERAQYTMWVYALLVNHQLITLEYARLEIEDQTVSSHRARMAGLMGPSLAKKVYYSLKDRFSPEMQVYIESTFAESSHERSVA
jgi:hypothetical protein